MTTPNPAASGSIVGGMGGRVSGGAFGGAPPPPKMTDEDIRLECIKQAVLSKARPESITLIADRMFEYIKNGSVSSRPTGSTP